MFLLFLFLTHRSIEEVIALFISIAFVADAVKGTVKSECYIHTYCKYTAEPFKYSVFLSEWFLDYSLILTRNTGETWASCYAVKSRFSLLLPRKNDTAHLTHEAVYLVIMERCCHISPIIFYNRLQACIQTCLYQIQNWCIEASTIFIYFNCNLFLWWQSWIFSSHYLLCRLSDPQWLFFVFFFLIA